MPDPTQAGHAGGEIDVGAVIGGKYVVRSRIGDGGMGLVLEAEHVHLEERVAIKVLTNTADRAPAARKRFMREARLTAKLRGEHTVRVTDFGLLDGGTPYMVMELLRGENLRTILRREMKLPVEVAVRYAVQVCYGLAEAHALGIVHRDLKPSNLFLTRRTDGGELLKVVDFGISKTVERIEPEAPITATGALLGSPRYMAPEQLHDSARVDARADIWSLGVVLYEMLAGHPPFAGESYAALCHEILSREPPSPLAGRVRDVTPQLEAVVMRCLAHDPQQRWPDAAEVVLALHEATALEGLDAAVASVRGILQRENHVDSSAHPAILRPPGSMVSGTTSGALTLPDPALWQAKPQSRRRSFWVALPAVGIVVLGLAAFTWYRTSPPTSPRAALPPPVDTPAGTVTAVTHASATVAETDAAPDVRMDPSATPPSSAPPPRPRRALPVNPVSTAERRARNPFGDRY